MFSFPSEEVLCVFFFLKEFTDYGFVGQFDPTVFISTGVVKIPLIVTILKWRKSTMMPFPSVADWHDLLRMHTCMKKNKTFFVGGGAQTMVRTSIRMQRYEGSAAASLGISVHRPVWLSLLKVCPTPRFF